MKTGTYATAVRNALATQTYPDHITLIKGVWPADHHVDFNAWFDPLRDEGAAYAAALERVDVPVKHYAGEGLIHGYFGLGEASAVAKSEAQLARADFSALLNRQL